jgi:hypothetical protein
VSRANADLVPLKAPPSDHGQDHHGGQGHDAKEHEQEAEHEHEGENASPFFDQTCLTG